MSPPQSEAAKEFRKPSATIPPPDRKGHPGKFYLSPSHSYKSMMAILKITGKSFPITETFRASMVGVYESRKDLGYFHRFCITSKKFAGIYTVLIFMDNRLDHSTVRL